METEVLQTAMDSICASAHADCTTLFVSTRKKGDSNKRKGDPEVLVAAGSHTLNGDKATSIVKQQYELASKSASPLDPMFISHLSEYAVSPAIIISRKNSNNDLTFHKESQDMQSAAVAPLYVGKKLCGIVLFAFSDFQPFEPDQRRHLTNLVQQTALWVQQVFEVEARNRRHAKELRDLRNIDHAISSSLDLSQVLQTIIESAQRHLRAPDGMIALYNPQTQTLEARAVVGRARDERLQWTSAPDPNRGVTQSVFKYGTPTRIDDLPTHPRWSKIHSPGSSPARSEIAVPLQHAREVVGVINFESPQRAAFSQADEDFLVTLADQAVLAIKNAEAYEQAQRVAEERKTFVDIGKEISSRLVEQGKTYNLILKKAVQITHATAATLHFFDSHRQDLLMAAQTGGQDNYNRPRQVLGEGIVGIVAKTKERLNVGEVNSPPWDTVYIPFIPGIHSELAVPLLVGGALLGVMNVESRKPNGFGPPDEELLTALADQAVIAIQNTRRYQQTEQGRHRLNQLHELDQHIIEQLNDLTAVMHMVLETALSLTQSQNAIIWLPQRDLQATIYSAEKSMAGSTSIQFVTRVEQLHSAVGLLNHVSHTRQAYRTLTDAQEDSHFRGPSDIHSAAATALVTEQEFIGVLQIESKQSYAFDEDDLNVLNLLAGQAVISIQKAQAYARAETERRRFERLYQAGERLGKVTDLGDIDDAYQIIVDLANDPSTSRQVAIRRHDSARKELKVVRHIANHLIEARDHADDQGANGWVFQKKERFVLLDVDNPPPGMVDVPNTRIPHERSIVVVPILYEKQVYGTLTLSHTDRNHFQHLPDADLQLFEGLANQLAITIHRLDSVHARQQDERRIKEMETLSELGHMALELTHRLGNDLGLVTTHVNNIHAGLRLPYVEQRRKIDIALEKIVRDVQLVLKLARHLIDDVTDLMSDTAGEHTKMPVLVKELLQTTAKSSPDMPPNIRVDVVIEDEQCEIYVFHQHQIEAILHNLFTNAIHAMPNGGTIALRAKDIGNDIVFEVEDNGTGIPLHHQPYVFNLFYSAKGSTGIGLWSARFSAERHGGKLEMESAEGKGTTFRLTLPKGRRGEAPLS